MEKLDLSHHKIIMLLFVLVVFISGILFGVKIDGATRGTEGLQIIMFALIFLGIVMLFIIFTQVIHLREEMNRLESEELEILRKGKKRGQAALEFIMTYGWAIVVILIMIGALSYFGVINPSKFLPDKCLFTTGIACQDFQAVNNGGNLQLKITVANKQGSAMTIQSFTASTLVGGIWYSNTNGCGVTMPVSNIDVDQTQNFTCTFTGANPGVGQPVKFNISLVYLPGSGVYSHTATDQVATSAQ